MLVFPVHARLLSLLKLIEGNAKDEATGICFVCVVGVLDGLFL